MREHSKKLSEYFWQYKKTKKGEEMANQHSHKFSLAYLWSAVSVSQYACLATDRHQHVRTWIRMELMHSIYDVFARLKIVPTLNKKWDSGFTSNYYYLPILNE